MIRSAIAMKVPTVTAAAIRGLLSSAPLPVSCPVAIDPPVEVGVPLVMSVSSEGQLLLGVGVRAGLAVVSVRSGTLLIVDWLVCDNVDSTIAATEVLEDSTVVIGAGICETLVEPLVDVIATTTIEVVI